MECINIMLQLPCTLYTFWEILLFPISDFPQYQLSLSVCSQCINKYGNSGCVSQRAHIDSKAHRSLAADIHSYNFRYTLQTNSHQPFINKCIKKAYIYELKVLCYK